MNCKPGDLAVIVKCDAEDARHHIGKIVRCLKRVDTRQGMFGWMTDPMLYTKHGLGIAWHDGVLRPIRDPGEDARDETLSWLDVPETTPEMLDREVEHG